MLCRGQWNNITFLDCLGMCLDQVSLTEVRICCLNFLLTDTGIQQLTQAEMKGMYWWDNWANHEISGASIGLISEGCRNRLQMHAFLLVPLNIRVVLTITPSKIFRIISISSTVNSFSNFYIIQAPLKYHNWHCSALCSHTYTALSTIVSRKHYQKVSLCVYLCFSSCECHNFGQVRLINWGFKTNQDVIVKCDNHKLSTFLII